MTGILNKLGYPDIDIAQNGLEVLQLLEKHKYHAILMDLSMPVMDGLTATEKIRTTSFSCNPSEIPIIALTAHAIKGDREMCLARGMNDYLTKPINPDDLRRILDKWVHINSPEPIETADVNQSQQRNEIMRFDYERMLNRLMGDEQLAGHILQLFLKETPGQLSLLRKHIKGNNLQDAGYMAHKLMGASANVDVNEFYTIARTIEEKCYNGKAEELASLLKRLEQQFELVRHDMVEILLSIEEVPG